MVINLVWESQELGWIVPIDFIQQAAYMGQLTLKLIFFLCLFTGIPVYIPCTGSVPANSVVSVVVGVCYLSEFLIISLSWTWIFIIVDKDVTQDEANYYKKYHKHLCISRTILDLVWFWT